MSTAPREPVRHGLAGAVIGNENRNNVIPVLAARPINRIVVLVIWNDDERHACLTRRNQIRSHLSWEETIVLAVQYQHR